MVTLPALSPDQSDAWSSVATLLAQAGIGIDDGHLAPANPDRAPSVLAITGKAGSGKSMLLASLTRALRDAGVEVVSPDWEGKRKKEKRTLAILAPIAASFLQMALSRSREYEADRRGAKLLNDGEPLARALEKLDRGTKLIPSAVNPVQAGAYIANPLAGQKSSFSARLATTHPPMEDRIARLRAGEWRN